MREMVSGGAEEKVSLYRPISPHISPISTLYLPYISPYLPVSPMYLPALRSSWTRISPVSPHPQEHLDPYLPCISPPSGAAGRPAAH